MLLAATYLVGSFPGPLLGQTGSAFSGILPIVLMFAVVYFLVLRPMSRQEKDRKKRVETLAKGDQVVIGGGIIGRISNLDDPKIAVVEIADKVKVRVLRKDIVDTMDAAMKDGKAAPAAPKAEEKPAPAVPKADEKAAKPAADKDKSEAVEEPREGR